MSGVMQLRKRWVLITGASSGLGEEMARQLAADQQANLILVARRTDRLEALGAQLQQRYGIEYQTIGADLSVEADVVNVFEAATREHAVQGVILNAGITHFGEHTDMPWDTFQQLLATNVTSVVRLASLFVPYLREHDSEGGIMMVASMAGLVPVPYQAAYSGSKGFICNFGLSLAEEVRGEPFSVTVFAPGGIATPMTHDSGLRYFENTTLLQTVEDCAREGLRAFQHRRRLKVPGLLNRMQLLITRLAPRTLVTLVTASAYRRALNATSSL